MCSQWAALAMSALVILSAVAKPLAPPTTGWLYNFTFGSFIFPFTATQCEPFYIFYNTTMDGDFFFYDLTNTHILFTILFPNGTGYLEWICNIPAGFTFNVFQKYIVQPGSSSACLEDITTTYSDLYYATTVFASYTRTASPLVTPPLVTPLSTNTQPTASFLTGAFSTITLNPNLAVTPTSSTSSPPSSTLSSPSSSSPLSSPSSSSPLSSPSSSSPLSSPTTPPAPKSHSASIAGGVVGAIAFVLLILTLVLWWRRRRSALARASSPIDPQPASISGLATGELESMDLSSPFRFSGTEFLRGEQLYQFSPPDPRSRRTEPTSDNPIVVQMTGTPAAHAYPIVGQRSSQRAIIPLEAESAHPSQQPREALDSGHQASFPKPVPDSASPADPQPPSVQFSNAPANTAPETSLPNPTPQLQPPSTAETQDGNLDFAAILGVISHARLSSHERRVITFANNLLIEASSASPDLARHNTTASSPPPYTD